MKTIKREGMLLVISGPSGAGKSTICNGVREQLDDLEFSVSCTTRSPRGDEKHGDDYFFLSVEEFEQKIEQGDFLEYANVHGNYYGTLRSEVMRALNQGKDIILDIDVQGAMTIKKENGVNSELSNYLEFLFIAPPSYPILEKRLRGRATDSEESIVKRLSAAREELSFWNKYDYLILNSDITQSINEMRSLIIGLRNKTQRLKGDSFEF
jgi:guanylate kinase